MESNSTTIKLSNGTELRIKSKGLPEDFDVDRVLKIDYANIPAEMATLPILMNNVGIILADLENEVRISELTLKKQKAIMAEAGREEIKKDKLGKPATNDETLEYIRRQPKYDVLNRKVSTSMRNRDVINSIYWSIKSKQEIVQNLSKSMSYGDFNDALIGCALKEINYVQLSKREPLIK